MTDRLPLMVDGLNWLIFDDPHHIFNLPAQDTKKGTWGDHLKAIRNYCKSHATIYDNTNTSGGTITQKANDCNSWDCEECRKKKASRLKSRIKAGISKQSWRLLTLTFDPKKQSLEDSLNACSHMWDSFQKRLSRKFPGIKYVKILEFQESGYPHFHVIANRFLPHAWLVQNWTELGGGKIVDIRAIKTERIAGYVSQYLSSRNSKHHERDWQYFVFSLRRFSFSRNFPIQPWEKRTIVYHCSIPFDVAGSHFDEVVRLGYSKGTFFAVVQKNQIKYINCHSSLWKTRLC